MKRARNKVLNGWSCRCGNKVAVWEIDQDQGLLPGRMKCWKLGCRYYLIKVKKVGNGFTVLPALEIYRRSMGLGEEEERKASPTSLRKLLLGRKVVAAALEVSTDPNRSFITTLTMDSGAVLHFAASVRGATIFKVTQDV